MLSAVHSASAVPAVSAITTLQASYTSLNQTARSQFSSGKLVSKLRQWTPTYDHAQAWVHTDRSLMFIDDCGCQLRLPTRLPMTHDLKLKQAMQNSRRVVTCHMFST